MAEIFHKTKAEHKCIGFFFIILKSLFPYTFVSSNFPPVEKIRVIA